MTSLDNINQKFPLLNTLLDSTKSGFQNLGTLGMQA
ncbi:Uncharacterised protein [Alloiococcus otitis]|nr:Uncharacterised protein [Alloiococcus otitis]